MRMREWARTCGDNVIYNKNFLSLLDCPLLHLEIVGAVLLHVLGGDARTGQLALLADRDKAGTKLQGEGWAEKKATGVETNNDIGLDGVVVTTKVQKLELQGVEQSGMGFGVEEPGHDIQEVDTGDRKIGKAA